MSDKQANFQSEAFKSHSSKSHYYRNQNSGDGSWSEFFGDLYSGVAVGIGHPKWFVVNQITRGWNAFDRVVHSSFGIKLPLSSEEDFERKEAGIKEQMARIEGGLKVVGVGFGRTGTYSLALALDDLGFPTLHTQHLYENADIFNMWVNNVFYRSIQEEKIIMGTPDFKLLLEAGYVGTMDLPFALYFNQIREQYPDCKFILTLRENSEVWFKSWDVLTSSITQPAQYTSFIFTHVKKLEYYMRWLFSVVNKDKKFLNHPFPFPPQIKSNAIESYEMHNQLVRDTIPSSHLLEYNVKQGWEPLCKFLDIPEPQCPLAQGIPFPKSNSARAVQIQSFSSFFGPLVLSVFLLFSIFSLFFRKVMGLSVISWCHVQKLKFLRWTSASLEYRSKNFNKSKEE